MVQWLAEVTLKDHRNNGLAILHGIISFLPRRTELYKPISPLINPFSSDAYQSYNTFYAGHYRHSYKINTH